MPDDSSLLLALAGLALALPSAVLATLALRDRWRGPK